MEHCTLCGKPCITDEHYRVVDVVKNKAVGESVFCQRCGLSYIQSAFNPKEAASPPPVKEPSNYKFHVIKSPEELLEVMLGKGMILEPTKISKKDEPPCPGCGVTVEEFTKKGRFGCPTCYTHYYETFLAMAGTFQAGANQHVGKRPKIVMKKEKEIDLNVLRLRMTSAIEQEMYEEAARIRDQIRAFEDDNNISEPDSSPG